MNGFVKIFRCFNVAKVRYLVVGGVAVNLHGYPRFTGDLDILLFLDEENLKKVDNVMRKLSYSERLPVSIMDLKDKNLKAFTFNPPYGSLLQVDIVIEASLKFDKFFKKRLVKVFDGVRIPVVSIEDLIEMKKKTGRSKDKIDLSVLKILKQL